MSEERLDRIEAKVDALAGDVDRRLDALGIEMRTLNQETRHEMRVLHEEVLDRIAALAPDFAPIRREFMEATRHSANPSKTALSRSKPPNGRATGRTDVSSLPLPESATR